MIASTHFTHCRALNSRVETLSITDRAYIISDGRILAHGVPEDLVANELVKKSYLGEEFRLYWHKSKDWNCDWHRN